MIDRSANSRSRKPHLRTASEGVGIVGDVNRRKAMRFPGRREHVLSGCQFGLINLNAIPLLSDEATLQEPLRLVVSATLKIFSHCLRMWYSMVVIALDTITEK